MNFLNNINYKSISLSLLLAINKEQIDEGDSTLVEIKTESAREQCKVLKADRGTTDERESRNVKDKVKK